MWQVSNSKMSPLLVSHKLVSLNIKYFCFYAYKLCHVNYGIDRQLITACVNACVFASQIYLDSQSSQYYYLFLNSTPLAVCFAGFSWSDRKMLFYTMSFTYMHWFSYFLAFKCLACRIRKIHFDWVYIWLIFLHPVAALDIICPESPQQILWYVAWVFM